MVAANALLLADLMSVSLLNTINCFNFQFDH